VDDVHVRLEFVVPVQDIEVIGVVAEGPRHVEVPRKESEYNRYRKTEPKDGGAEQKVIIAVDRCHQPTKIDDGINGSVYPDERNADEDRKEHPSSPDFGIESVEQIGNDGCGDDHRRGKFILGDIEAIFPGGRREVPVEENEEDDDRL